MQSLVLKPKTLGLVDACVPGSSARESACGVLERAIASGDYLKRRAALQLPHILNKSENDFLLATTGAAILGRTKRELPGTDGCFQHHYAGCYEVDTRSS